MLCVHALSLSKYPKQVDGCSMRNPLSPTLANIFMCKLEEDVVTPHNLPFYDWYVDYCFTKRKTIAPNNLLEKLNMQLPSKHQVHRGKKPWSLPGHLFQPSRGKLHHQSLPKPGKLQVHWKSVIPERWKRNTILGAVYRAKRIAIKAGYLTKLVNEVIRDYENPKSDETIIPVHWFNERPKLGIRLPFCRTNEVESRKLNTYTKCIQVQLLYHVENTQDGINLQVKRQKHTPITHHLQR